MWMIISGIPHWVGLLVRYGMAILTLSLSLSNINFNTVLALLDSLKPWPYRNAERRRLSQRLGSSWHCHQVSFTYLNPDCSISYYIVIYRLLPICKFDVYISCKTLLKFDAFIRQLPLQTYYILVRNMQNLQFSH